MENEILETLPRYTIGHSIDEVATNVKRSYSTTRMHLKRLLEKGLVARTAYKGKDYYRRIWPSEGVRAE